MGNGLTCPACRSSRAEATVRFGSYVLRCAACGIDIVATSFLALCETDDAFRAYRDPGHGRRPAPEALIAEGPLRQIAAAVRSAANDGTSVLLVPHG